MTVCEVIQLGMWSRTSKDFESCLKRQTPSKHLKFAKSASWIVVFGMTYIDVLSCSKSYDQTLWLRGYPSLISILNLSLKPVSKHCPYTSSADSNHPNPKIDSSAEVHLLCSYVPVDSSSNFIRNGLIAYGELGIMFSQRIDLTLSPVPTST